MKRNLDCMRDILLYIEQSQGFERNILRPFTIKDLLCEDLTAEYNDSDIIYSVKQLIGCGLLEGADNRQQRKADYIIYDISPQGHEFLNNIRKESLWIKTKEIAEKTGSFAIKVISNIASDLVLNMIRS